ncbi:hypothetical protein RJ639_028374 [Escallonia herrerae]|uniref:PGG domain-containing protein n=1 Tax=Escallonia herrerae TaxID=1293975 RepID=A0AA89BGZ9_9ASTE|nr:hypothetical protein RJ639_028374 [Escallonia herrerae]
MANQIPEDNDTSASMDRSYHDICAKETTCTFPDKLNHESSPFLGINSSVISSHILPPEMINPCSSVSNTHYSNFRPGQTVSNSTSVLEMHGNDAQVVFDPSMWQISANYPSMSQCTEGDANLTARQVDAFTNLSPATVPCSGEISGERRGNSLRKYVDLYIAALKGDWAMAKEFLQAHPEALNARITRGSETALHIAAAARNASFVEELVTLMTPNDLALQNTVGNTALCFAAASGIISIAAPMVNKNRKLPLIRGSNGALPLYMAALLGHKDMVWYLYKTTDREDLTRQDRIMLLIAAITSNLFDVALDVIQRYPELALDRDENGDTALHVLARKPSAFLSGSQLGIFERCIYSCPDSYQGSATGKDPKIPRYSILRLKVIYCKKAMQTQALELVRQLWHQVLLEDDLAIGALIRFPSRLLFIAAELGIVEFVIVLIQSYPDLIWKVDDKCRSIFHIAVEYRQEKIFNLIYEIGAIKDLIAARKDEHNTNLLHLAAKLAPPNRLNIDSGAALQLRRELLWFKEVEKIVQPLYKQMKDSNGRTPGMLFTEEHKGLVCEGEKWMKDTASSCMVVATLITTVMFAAAFTVPGGDNDVTGSPIFLSHLSFLVFAISDALALFSSATSILMFLSIVTSRYAEEDFLDSLPNRLILGLATLFISIATMMVSFCATIFIVLGRGFAWVALPLVLLAGIPVTLFAMLQFPLFVDMLSHTYRSSSLFRPRSRLLF